MRIVTIDLGTGSIKACLWVDGALMDFRQAALRTAACGATVTQNPSEWWDACISLLKQIADSHPDYVAKVDVIGITGQMHAVVPVDATGYPLVETIPIVSDRRAARTGFADAEREFGWRHVLARTGGRLDPTTVLAKLRHLHTEGADGWKQARYLLPPKDYLRFRLTGVAATDPTDAAGTLLYDFEQMQWADELVEFAGVRGKMPPVRPTLSLSESGLTRTVAEATGFAAGTPVAIGGGDDIETLGAGAWRPGDLFEHLGSTGSIYAVVAAPVRDRSGIVETYPDILPGQFLVGGSTSAAGLALTWAGGLAGNQNWSSFLDNLLEDRSPSSLLFLPYLHGERMPLWDADRSGALIGLRAEHQSNDVQHAVLEGVAFSLRHSLDALRDVCDLPANGPVYTAGPLGTQPAYAALRADLYNRPVRYRGDSAHTTSFAAMVIAHCALSGEDPFGLADKLLATRWEHRPDLERSRVWDRAYHHRYRKAVVLLDDWDTEEAE